jgi:RNA polymerase sigma-70 factor (ECF subfamily)
MNEKLPEAEPAGAQLESDSDLPLLERILAGEDQAFEDLVRRHERRVYRITLAITGNREDAEEAMQDAFFNVYRHLKEFEGTSRFTTWLTRVAINEALQKLRRRRNTTSLDDPAISDDQLMPQRTDEWHANPEQRYAVQELRQLVEEAIRSLPPAYRVAFTLRDVENLSTEEAAEALGLSIAGLKSRILRARLMVREALAARFERPPSLKSRMLRARWAVQQAVAARFRRAGNRGDELQ